MWLPAYPLPLQGFWDVAPPDRNLTRQELYLLQARRVYGFIRVSGCVGRAVPGALPLTWQNLQRLTAPSGWLGGQQAGD